MQTQEILKEKNEKFFDCSEQGCQVLFFRNARFRVMQSLGRSVEIHVLLRALCIQKRELRQQY